jgi:hypothetical protein
MPIHKMRDSSSWRAHPNAFDWINVEKLLERTDNQKSYQGWETYKGWLFKVQEAEQTKQMSRLYAALSAVGEG